MLRERMRANRWFHSTVQELFVETCEDRPSRTALVFEDEPISFGEMRENVNRMSQALISLGVGPGDHVVMLPTVSPEFAYVYFAALQVGALINPLNLLWGEIEFTGILARNDPKVIVTIDENRGRNYVQLLRDCIPDLRIGDGVVSSERIPTLTHLVSLSRQRKRHEGFLDFGELMETATRVDEAEIAGRIEKAKCTDIQFLCQTSGSTGLSKSAMWNHRPPMATAHFVARASDCTEEDSFLCMTPFFHNSGMIAMNLALAYAGTTMYLMENFDPQKAMEIMDRYGPTSTVGFDAHYQALRTVHRSGKYRFSITKALGAITPRTYDLIEQDLCEGRDVNIVMLYAQTENGPAVSLGEPDCMSRELKRSTNGRPLPGVAVVIKDIATGEKVAPGQQGEICYKSPFLMSGYYKQEEETKRLFDEEGYLHSGDYGTFEDGYIRFLGRLGGVVKSGGENVSTTYVSSLLLELFAADFEDVLTLGVPDPYWGTKIVSFVRMRPGRKLMETKEIRQRCKGKMAEYEIPKDIFEWEGPWPMTVVGKMDFKALQKALEERLSKPE
jgi:fatty-acyl-CoA synthase